MVKEIFTGNRSGADKAAREIAARLGIRCDTPTGIDSAPGAARTASISHFRSRNAESEKRRIDAGIAATSGTLIFSRGALNPHTNYVRERTLRLKHQLLGVDLAQMTGPQAAALIASWIKLYRLHGLYISGPDAKEDPAVYAVVSAILKSALLQARAADPNAQPKAVSTRAPRSVDAALTALMADLSYGDKSRIANMKKEKLGAVDRTPAERLNKACRLWLDDAALLESCRQVSKDAGMCADEAVDFLIKRLWQQLQKSDVLKIVK